MRQNVKDWRANTRQLLKLCTTGAALWVMCAQGALAEATGMPWEGPLEMILESISGPVAKILGVFAIVIAGIGIAFGESGSGMRRIFQIIMGLSIAFTASSLVVDLFGFTGGAGF